MNQQPVKLNKNLISSHIFARNHLKKWNHNDANAQIREISDADEVICAASMICNFKFQGSRARKSDVTMRQQETKSGGNQGIL